MKKVIAILLILTLVFIAGCGLKQTKDVTPTDSTQDSTETSVEINELDSELSEISDLEEELDLSDLDSLDEDLNFEI